MGVDKLEGFMYVKKLTRPVDLRQLIRNFDKPNPFIVLEHVRLHNIFKGSYQAAKEHINRFIEDLKALGTDVVWITENNLNTMTDGSYDIRRQRDIEEARRIYKMLYEHNSSFLLELPLHRQVVLTTFAEAGVRFERGSRRDLMKFAKNESCVALLAQDSDFLIYKEPKYLSIMSLKDMNTVEFQLDNLKEKLKLTSEQLPRFAALTGCTFVDRRMLEPLHKFILTNASEHAQRDYTFGLLLAVAEFVRKTSKAQVNKLLREHLCSETVNAISLAIAVYTGEEAPTIPQELSFPLPFSTNTLEARRMLFNFAYETFAVPIYNDNERDPKYTPTCVRLLPLRKKIYALLRRDEGVVMENTIDGINEVRFDGPKVTGIDFGHLWSETATDEIIKLRRTLFCDGVHPELSYSDIKGLEKRYVLPVCALIYLQNAGSIRGTDLSGTEIRCVIATMLSVEKWKSIVPFRKAITPRCFQVSTVFMATCDLLWAYNVFCGQVIPVEETCPSKYYDLKLFSTLAGSPEKVEKILKESKHFDGIMDCLRKFSRD